MKMLRILNQQRQRKISISFVWRIIFKRERTKRYIDYRWNCLYYWHSTREWKRHTTQKNLRFMKFVVFFSCRFSSSQRNSISIIGEKRIAREKHKYIYIYIWIKSFHPRCKSAYRRAIIESQLRISIASRDQIFKCFPSLSPKKNEDFQWKEKRQFSQQKHKNKNQQQKKNFFA